MVNRDARLDEPMSDARLREIRKGIEFNQMGMDEDEALFAISDLLAEVERLRAREAALVAITEKVWTLAVQSAYDDRWFIPRVHATHELVEQARALLAAAASEQGEV